MCSLPELKIKSIGNFDDACRYQRRWQKGGVEVLKKYIGFAETKILQEAKSTDREIESPFQHWAINQVNALPGFSAEWEIEPVVTVLILV